MKEIGLTVEKRDYQPNKPNILGRLVGKNERPILMLNGHMDTVPADEVRSTLQILENSRIFTLMSYA